MSITRRDFLAAAGRTAAGFVGAAIMGEAISTHAEAGARKPNFVFVLMDDMGWSDLGCYGNTFHETPNIDRLASQGMRFTQAYAACPVCSPTRASILTGKYPARVGITDWIPGYGSKGKPMTTPDFHQELPLSEVTIAEMLKRSGYRTGYVGKWHLGKVPYYPTRQGFDVNIGGTHQGHPPSYFDPYGIPSLPDRKEGEYLTDRLTDEALKFIEESKDQPFLLYLAHYAVHTPLQAKKELIEKYEARVKPGMKEKAAVYAAMHDSVDESIGRLMKKLDELKLAENTVFIFFSDNGGLERVTSNAPLRAGKAMLYEGGIREPLIVRWPGKVKAGSVCDSVVMSTDFFPTMLDMAGSTTPRPKNLDGVSMLPLLTQTGSIRREAVYWHFPHYHPVGATPAGAIRKGDWKLIEYFEDGHVELYNIREDLSEKNDLAQKMPDKAAELRKQLAEWRESVSARMPTPNPEYVPPAL